MKRSFLFVTTVALLIASGCSKNDGAREYTSILEGTTIQVPALTGGQIVAMLIETGQQVKEDDLLARIDSLELSLQYQQLIASYDEIKIQKRIASTALERVERDLSYVKQKYDRVEKLFRANSIAKQDYDDISNQLSQANSARETATQNLQTLGARLRQFEAQMALNRKKINDTVILAPLTGIITTKYYEPGEAVSPLRPVVEIMDITKLEAKIYIEETMLPQIRQGQEVELKIDGSEKSFSGTVSWISPRAEFTPKSILTPDTRTSLVYAVQIDIENPDGIMKDGMPVIIIL